MPIENSFVGISCVGRKWSVETSKTKNISTQHFLFDSASWTKRQSVDLREEVGPGSLGPGAVEALGPANRLIGEVALVDLHHLLGHSLL